MKMKYAITNDKIVFEIEIPIIFKNKYNLYKFLRIPEKTKTNLVYLKTNDNIAIEENKLNIDYYEKQEIS